MKGIERDHSAPVTVWEPRTYPGDLAQGRRVRHDLTRDLAGFDGDLVDLVHLCAGELFANAAKYTDSRLAEGEVLRFLSRPDPCTLRLGFTDAGGSGAVPRIPRERSEQEWGWAEGQRGLVIIDQLARAWGHHRAAPWADLGTYVWVDLSLAEGQAPRTPRRYVFAD